MFLKVKSSECDCECFFSAYGSSALWGTHIEIKIKHLFNFCSRLKGFVLFNVALDPLQTTEHNYTVLKFSWRSFVSLYMFIKVFPFVTGPNFQIELFVIKNLAPTINHIHFIPPINTFTQRRFWRNHFPINPFCSFFQQSLSWILLKHNSDSDIFL